METTKYLKSWQGVSSLEEIKQLIDVGILLKWREMRTLKRNFSMEQQIEIIKHMTKRLCERASERLSAEILIESLLIWLANSPSEELASSFIDQIFEEPSRAEACKALVEISLTTEVIDNAHDEAIFSSAVLLICELGLAIYHHETRNPGEFDQAKRILANIDAYLLSVSNYNNSSIRLSLLHYFGETNVNKDIGSSFSKVMGRFGHTVLDHLFTSLFTKKSEAIALQYLLENLSHVLESDVHCQRILHETFKAYMLKKPERFALFVRAMSEQLVANGDGAKNAREVFLQHIGSLIQVVNELSHKELSREFITCVNLFQDDPMRLSLLRALDTEMNVKPFLKDILGKVKAAKNQKDLESKMAKMGQSKRGRKPSFSRTEPMPTMDQVCFLGNVAS